MALWKDSLSLGSSIMSLISTDQGSGSAGFGELMVDEELLAVLKSSGLAVHEVHAEDGTLGSMEADELEETFSGGGVTLRGCGAKYDFRRISQKDIISVPSSITPFNLIPYLDIYETNPPQIYAHVLPGNNVLEFHSGALLPMQGNGAFLGVEAMQCSSVALTVTPNDKNFLPDILFERI